VIHRSVPARACLNSTQWRLSKYEQDSGDVVQQVRGTSGIFVHTTHTSLKATEIVTENVWFSENFVSSITSNMARVTHGNLAGQLRV
jgi:hypothetical protein